MDIPSVTDGPTGKYDCLGKISPKMTPKADSLNLKTAASFRDRINKSEDPVYERKSHTFPRSWSACSVDFIGDSDRKIDEGDATIQSFGQQPLGQQLGPTDSATQPHSPSSDNQYWDSGPDTDEETNLEKEEDQSNSLNCDSEDVDKKKSQSESLDSEYETDTEAEKQVEIKENQFSFPYWHFNKEELKNIKVFDNPSKGKGRRIGIFSITKAFKKVRSSEQKGNKGMSKRVVFVPLVVFEPKKGAFDNLDKISELTAPCIFTRYRMTMKADS